MKKSFSIIFLLTLAFTIHAQDSTRTGLLYGYNNAYYLTAPVGWVMDNENGKEDGLTAVFYPKGSTWIGSETVMYTTFTSFDSIKKETVNDIIKNDSVVFKGQSPQLLIKRQKPIMLKKRKIPVVAYSGEAESYYENVAYIQEKKGVVMIIISSHNKNGCINNYKDFEALVRSYRFLTDKVNINLGK